MVVTYDTVCLIGHYMRRKSIVRLSREFRNNKGKKICTEFITKEREKDAEHLRGCSQLRLIETISVCG